MENSLISKSSVSAKYSAISEANLLISRISRKKASLFGMVISAGICILLAILNIFKEDNEELVKILGIIGLVINRFVLC